MDALQHSSSNNLSRFQKEVSNSLDKNFSVEWDENGILPGIRSLYYDAKHHLLAISNVGNGKIQLIGLRDGKFRTSQLHTTTIRKVMIYNDEIITACWDRSIKVSNLTTLKTRLHLTEASMGRCPHFHIDQINNHLYSFSYDSDVSLDKGNTIRKWSLNDGSLLQSFSASDFCAPTNRGGTSFVKNDKLFIASDSGYLRVYDTRNGLLLRERTMLPDFTQLIPYGKNQLLISTQNGMLYLADEESLGFKKEAKCLAGDILNMKYHPYDPNLIAISDITGQVIIFNINEWRTVNSIDTKHYQPWGMAFMDNNLLVGHYDGEILVYDMQQIENIRLKGRLICLHDSFLAQLSTTKHFYTNQPNKFSIRFTEPNAGYNKNEASYMFHKYYNRSALTELFDQNEFDAEDTKPILLLK